MFPKRQTNLVLTILCATMCGCNPSSESGTSTEDKTPSGVISFVSTRDGNFEIYSMNADGGNVANLSKNEAVDFSPSWSPDGKQLLFYSDRDGNNEIYRMNMDGSNQVNISNSPANEYLPQWSPDGTKIVFTSDRDHSSREIYTMNVDGSQVKRLTVDEEYNESPSWSPDMQKILFTRQLKDPSDTSHAANGEIFIMDADGMNPIRLTNKEGFDSGGSISPDGSSIAFYGESEKGYWDIFIMDADGSNVLNLTDDEIEDYSPSWSPDGQWIAYTSGTSQQYDVWIIHIATRERIRLTQEPKRNANPAWRPN